MSKEKQQINEMALAICKSRGVAEVDDCSKCGRHADCLYYEIASALYKADYRRQSKGEWIDRYNGKYANPIYVCSQCGEVPLEKTHINELNTMELIDALSSFCPNCGAKMKGGAE